MSDGLRVGDKDLTVADLEQLFKAMNTNGVAFVDVGGLKIQMAPKLSAFEAQPAQPPEAAPEEMTAPWAAFRRDLKPDRTPAPARPADPSSPDAPLDDSRLFATDLPQS